MDVAVVPRYLSPVRHLVWALAASLVVSACGSDAPVDTTATPDELVANPVQIPDVTPDSLRQAQRLLDSARDRVLADNTIAVVVEGNPGGVGSVGSSSVVDLEDEESEGTATFTYGIEEPFTLEMRAVDDRVFARPQTELCWFDYGEVGGDLDAWFPTALRLGTEAVAVGVAATDDAQVVAEVSALVAVSVVTSKLANSLPPEAQDSDAVVPVLVTLDDDGRLARTAFNYEEALDALVADGVDLSVVATDDPELSGVSSEALRENLAGPYLTTYTPTFGLDVQAPDDSERIDLATLDPSDPEAPVGCGVSP